jgi:hypothetical protein
MRRINTDGTSYRVMRIAYCDCGFLATKAQRHKEVSVSLVCLAEFARKASFVAKPCLRPQGQGFGLSFEAD